jgi:ABC-type lipoprotein release transport system permease subunit
LLPNPEAAAVTQVHRLPISLEPVYVVGSFLTVAVMAIISAVISTMAINRVKPMQVMKYGIIETKGLSKAFG